MGKKLKQTQKAKEACKNSTYSVHRQTYQITAFLQLIWLNSTLQGIFIYLET